MRYRIKQREINHVIIHHMLSVLNLKAKFLKIGYHIYI